ncbi:NAD-dependent epimerase/dehydratase family protein [Rhodobacteraceae bacterium 2CG4]|uniref:NAD-dependent epimerase/dehydratase family protein n=1 Tax=Halovulum marinum TaxID=2662447 RepID=A0A6L5Z168_9RHOB|nr:NAD-dependent epimerase/dehydratase family protein [Halovulum marinum]MSU90291.1 NAD-dependent epimerase/dehydratase family protein [Halovulum marinum]
MSADFPRSIADETVLEDVLSTPSAALVETLAALPGDITFLGVGGKIGPTLARMAKRAAPDKRIIGVARFSEPGLKRKLAGWGIETVTCDLLDRAAVDALEKTENAVFLAGRKFGSEGNLGLTWAMNVLCPAIVAEAFAASRLVVYSTACVYPFVDVTSGGAPETLRVAPPGEYANSCIGRERVFEHFANTHGTRSVILRLSYALDLRYGVLHDIARAVKAGAPVPLDMGHCNVIWQGSANDVALRALALAEAPPAVLNLSGPETASIRRLAERFGNAFGTEPVFTGTEQNRAWLVDTTLQQRHFGYPEVPLAQVVDWTADWVAHDRGSLGKPTHFEVRDGAY